MYSKIIISKYLVWPSKIAWAFYPFIFIKDKKYISDKLINHEKIHLKQQLELLIIPFYILYIFLYIINLLSLKPNAYRQIAFEKEAYEKEKHLSYLEIRKPFSWLKYI